MHKTHLLYKWR